MTDMKEEEFKDVAWAFHQGAKIQRWCIPRNAWVGTYYLEPHVTYRVKPEKDDE